MLNKIGPRTDPCGTPFKRADQELKDLLLIKAGSLCISPYSVRMWENTDQKTPNTDTFHSVYTSNT